MTFLNSSLQDFKIILVHLTIHHFSSSSLAEPNDPHSKKPSPKRSRRDEDDLHLDRHSKGSRTQTSHHHSSEINQEPADYRHKSKSGRDLNYNSDSYDQRDNKTHRTSHQDKDSCDSRERRGHVNSVDQRYSKYEDKNRSSKDRRKGREDKYDNEHRVDEQLSKRNSWIYPNLRVRMVDQRYKKGKYYNTKVSDNWIQIHQRAPCLTEYISK